jgi:hypothetical protein
MMLLLNLEHCYTKNQKCNEWMSKQQGHHSKQSAKKGLVAAHVSLA